MTFQIWKPLPQGKKGQACLGQECAGGGRLGYLVGGESLCAGHWVLLLAPDLARQSMGARRMGPASQTSGALCSGRDTWSLAEPLLGSPLAGEGSRYLGSKSFLRREHSRLPSLCTNHGSHESREVEEGILFNTGPLGELERVGILNTTPPLRSLLGGLL